MKLFIDILFRYVPFVFVYSSIFYLSSRTVSELPSDIPDIIPHFIEYFVLSFLFMRIVRSVEKKNILLSLIFLLLLAVLDEVHQIYVPTRIFSMKDVLVDSTGIIAGLALYMSKFLKVFK